MSYANPLTVAYNFGEIDFGAGGDITAIRVPAHITQCAIREIQVSATETFNATTTSAKVRVGTASDADKFAELDCATTADTDAVGTADDADAIKTAGQSIDLQTDGDSGAELAQLEVAFVAPTGGTPAGRGFVTIVLDWWG